MMTRRRKDVSLFALFPLLREISFIREFKILVFSAPRGEILFHIEIGRIPKGIINVNQAREKIIEEGSKTENKLVIIILGIY